MGEPGSVIQSEVQSNRKQISLVNIYLESRKIVQMSLLAGQESGAGVENGHADIVGKGRD